MADSGFGRFVGSVAGVVGLAMGGWVGAGIFLAGAALQYAFRRRPGAPSEVPNRQRNVNAQVSGSDASLPVVYGETVIGAKVLDIRNSPTDPNVLVMVVAFNLAGEDGGGCGPIGSIYFNDTLAIQVPVYESEPVTGSSIQPPWRPAGGGTFGVDQWLKYGLHSGADSQVVDSELDSVFTAYDSTHEGMGVQYLVLWMYLNDEAWPGGVPKVTALARGVQVHDPRPVADTTWQNGQNPILAARDFMRSTRYGMGIPDANILASSVTTEANYCEETPAVPGGTQQRFTLNGFIDPALGQQANLDRILSTCRGRVVDEGGVYRFVIHSVQAAETFELNETNILGFSEFWRAGAREAPNVMAATYVDADGDYQTDEVQFPAPGVANGFLTADNGQLNEAQIDLPLCTDRYQAEQTAQTLLKETRADAGCLLIATREALKLAHGDVVKVTHSTPGWTAKEFWVEAIGVTPDSGEIQVLLREYDATAYTLDSLATKDAPPGTDHPSPLPPNVTILGEDARSTGNEGGGSSGAQGWERELSLLIGASCRSIHVVYSFIRPHTAADQPPPSTTVDREYDKDVTPGTDVLVHVLEDGLGAAQTFLAQDDAGTTIFDGSFFVTVTPYDDTGGEAGSGAAGQIRSTLTRSLFDYDNVGARVIDSTGQAFAVRDLNLASSLTATQAASGAVTLAAPAAGSTLGGLTDVTISAVGTGEILAKSAGDWINRTLAEAGISAVGHAHSAADITSGVLVVAQGGTGVASPTVGNLLVGAGASAMTQLAFSTAGGFVRSSGSAWVRSTIQDSDIAASAVTQHEAALTVLESQITDGSLLARLAAAETVTAQWKFNARLQLQHETGDPTGTAGYHTLWGEAGPTMKFRDGTGTVSTIAVLGHVHTAGDITSGILDEAFGGTGVSNPTAGNLLVGAGASAMTPLAPGADGAFVKSASGAWIRASITAGDLPSHTHSATQITASTFSGSFTFADTLALDSASLNFTNTATNDNFLDWGGSGISVLRKTTDQGGLGIGADSSIMISAGDTLVANLAGAGIVAATSAENLYMVADAAVIIASNTQTNWASRNEWVFTAAGVTQLPAALTALYGGTGRASLTSGAALLGNGTGAVQMIAAATTGNYLRASGTAWASSNLLVGDLVGQVSVANGGTAASTLTANAVLIGNGASLQFAALGSLNQVLAVNGGGQWAAASITAAYVGSGTFKTGEFVFPGTVRIGDGTETVPALQVGEQSAGAGYGMYRVSTEVIGFAVRGAKKMQLEWLASTTGRVSVHAGQFYIAEDATESATTITWDRSNVKWITNAGSRTMNVNAAAMQAGGSYTLKVRDVASAAAEWTTWTGVTH